MSMLKKYLGIALLACLLLSAAPHCSANDDAEAPASGSAVPKTREGAEEYAFQAEVTRLMDIIIHSLYSNKDIFLRELISNAADALDKIRFLSLTDKTVLGEDDTAKLEIQISLDKETNTLYIRDRGIGMTHEDLVKNLGTIAKSGTSAFLEQMQKGGDINLIGQFGVGFYSVYLVADYVEVVSKHNDDKQYIWSSTADGRFTIVDDNENEPLGRGTLIKIHLKDEAQEYAQEWKLKQLVQKYSEFMNFPIYMREEKEVDVPVDDDEAADNEDEYEDDEEPVSDDDGMEDDDVEEEEEAPKTRKEKQLVWELVNDNKAIWLRSPKDVEDEEYQKFYNVISKASDKPLAWSHFKAEGDVEFKSVLYIPEKAPFDFYDKYYENIPRSIKLYVRRVFITDDVSELVPKYLSFVKGLVDSDTLPLQVSRELLQQHAALKTIKKKLVRKVLDMVKKMADDEVACNDPETDEEDRPTEEECKKFSLFYSAFGRAIKLGIMEDSTNRNRLAKLLRFHTSKSTDKLISLDEYVSRMKAGQKDIYFIAGKSMDELEKSPFVERLLKKDYEVVYFTDVLDEYLVQHLVDYDDKKLSDASKDGMRMSDKDEKQKKRDKELKAQFKHLTEWWKTALGPSSEVTSVKVSNRLESTPCIVVASKFGQSANMERIAKAQAFRDDRPNFASSQKILEINPRHPLVRSLKDKIAEDSEDILNKKLAVLLYETALIDSGFAVSDTKTFSSHVYDLVKDSLGVVSLDIEEEAAAEEEEEEEEAEADELDMDAPDFDLPEGMDLSDLGSMHEEL